VLVCCFSRFVPFAHTKILQKLSAQTLQCSSPVVYKECAWSFITPTDTTPPVLQGVPDASETLEANCDVPTWTVTATDNLDPNPTITVTDTPLGTCADGTYTSVERTWTAKDLCSNAFSETRTITLQDTKDPVFQPNPLPDITIEGGETIPIPTATDDCNAPVTITVTSDSDRTYEATCDPSGTQSFYSFTRTWTATDNCGKVATATQKITVKDTTPPLITPATDEVTVECGDAVPPPTVTDNCDGEITLSFEEGENYDVTPCGYSYELTWTATDVCGNVATAVTQIVHVEDTTPPELKLAVPDTGELQVDCQGDIPVSQVVVTDKCDAVAPEPSQPERSGSTATCDSEFTRTWRATDTCGNVGTLAQKILVAAQTIPDNNTKKKCFCFSASNSVNVQGKGIISIKSLQVGDMVQTSFQNGPWFSPVLSFMHFDHDTEVEYLQIHTNMAKMPLEITPDHFLFVDNLQTVRAGDVKVGDLLSDGMMVTSIQSIKRRGLYAPATENGEIMVSGVPASCYIDLLDGMAPSIQATVLHAALAPLRFMCGLDFAICKQEAYTQGGFSVKLAKLIELGHMLVDGTFAMQLLVVITCIPVLLGFLTVEMMLNHGHWFTLAVGGLYFLRQKKSKFE
jgi:hypothetical protein